MRFDQELANSLEVIVFARRFLMKATIHFNGGQKPLRTYSMAMASD